MKSYCSLNSALRAFNRTLNRFERLLAKLARIARKEGLIYGWDLPTMAIERPDLYSQFVTLRDSLETLRAWVRFYSVIPSEPLCFA